MEISLAVKCMYSKQSWRRVGCLGSWKQLKCRFPGRHRIDCVISAKGQRQPIDNLDWSSSSETKSLELMSPMNPYSDRKSITCKIRSTTKVVLLNLSCDISYLNVVTALSLSSIYLLQLKRKLVAKTLSDTTTLIYYIIGHH